MICKQPDGRGIIFNLVSVRWCAEIVERDGYIKLDRNLLDRHVFKNEKLLKTWIWCLLKARHTEGEVTIGFQKIWLKEGQFYTGRYNAGQELGFKPSTAWRYLKQLEKNESIKIIPYNKFSIITINNWKWYQADKYPPNDSEGVKGKSQNPDTKPDTKKQGQNSTLPGFEAYQYEGQVDTKPDTNLTSNEHQVDTNKNVKNEKNVKDIYAQQFEELWKIYLKKKDKEKAKKCYIARRNQGFTHEQLYAATEKYMAECKRKSTDKQYIKHGSTFLGPDKPFEEYLKKDGNEQEDLFKKRYGGLPSAKDFK